MALDNDFGLVYRWQFCPDCDADVELLEEGGCLFCSECWEKLLPWYADTGYRWRLRSDQGAGSR